VKTIDFINGKPSELLGEIKWGADLYCPEHGELQDDEWYMDCGRYDGYNWQSPRCKKCNLHLQGLPVDEFERNVYLKKHPNIKQSWTNNNLEVKK